MGYSLICQPVFRLSPIYFWRISIKMIARLLGDTEKMVLEVYNQIVDQKEDAAGAVNAAVI